MPPFAVVEPLDVVDDVRLGFVPGPVITVSHTLDLQGLEETLRHGVVPTIALATHAADHSVMLQNGPIVVAGGLASAIGVMQQTNLWSTVVLRHPESSQNQLTVYPVAHRPPYHST